MTTPGDETRIQIGPICATYVPLLKSWDFQLPGTQRIIHEDDLERLLEAVKLAIQVRDNLKK